jgi:carbon storage regulator
MLVLTRKPGERIFINDDIVFTILYCNAGQVRVGIEAPEYVSIHREEIYNKIKKEGFVQKDKIEKTIMESNGNE